MKHKIALGVLAVVLAAVTAVVVKRLMVTERDRVIRVVRRLGHHLQRRDPGSFCLLLADDYHDSHGHDRAALRALMTAGFPHFEWLSVHITDLQVEVTGETARAEFSAEVRGRGRDRAGPYRWPSAVRLQLRKQGREWRVVHADYRLPERVSY